MKARVSDRIRKILKDPKAKKELFANLLGGREEKFTITTKDGKKEEFQVTRQVTRH